MFVLCRDALTVVSVLVEGLRGQVRRLQELERKSTNQPRGTRKRRLTKLDPERRTLSHLRKHSQSPTAKLDDLPDQSQSETSAFTALLSAGLCLVEGI
jgi:hypothetical protein